MRRRVYFYEIRFQEFLSNSGQTTTTDLSTSAILGILNAIKNLPTRRNLRPNAYWMQGANGIRLQIDHLSSDILLGRLARFRRTDLPLLDSNGQLSDLNLPTDSGLFEPAHFAYFLSENHIAFEFNVHAPKIPYLGQYIIQKAKHECKLTVDEIEIWPATTGKILNRILRLGGLAEVELVIHSDQESVVKQHAPRIGSAIESLKQFAPQEYKRFKLTMMQEAYSRQPGVLGGQKSNLLREIMRLLGVVNDKDKASARVKVGGNGPAEWFDLLDDQYITTIDVPVDSNGRVRTDEIYGRLVGAYDGLKAAR